MVYLIDASVYIFRAWHSMSPDIRDPHGNPTHAVLGFAQFLGDVIERRKPQYVAVAFDECAEGSFRRKLYAPYKANREPAPPQLRRQFALCREYCRHLGVAEFASDEYEADDLIGTLAQRMRAEGLRVTVVSRDKDLAQLIGSGDVYWDYSDAAEYRYEQIAARFGVPPERIADYLALKGDSVDNVPGVPGIGAKTAAALMALFASLEELYEAPEHAARVSVRGAATLPAKLLLYREAAFLARTLTRIACDAPMAVVREDLRLRGPDLSGVAKFCEAQGFGMMLRRQAERLAQGALAHRVSSS